VQFPGYYCSSKCSSKQVWQELFYYVYMRNVYPQHGGGNTSLRLTKSAEGQCMSDMSSLVKYVAHHSILDFGLNLSPIRRNVLFCSWR